MEARLLGQALETTASPALSAKPDSVCGSVGMTARPTQPFFQPTPACSSRNLPPGCNSRMWQYSDLQGLRDEHHGLIQQRGDVAAHHRELAQRRHDGLLKGTVQEGLFGPLAFFDAFLQRDRHGIERLRQLAQLAPLARQPGAAGQVAGAPTVGPLWTRMRTWRRMKRSPPNHAAPKATNPTANTVQGSSVP